MIPSMLREHSPASSPGTNPERGDRERFPGFLFAVTISRASARGWQPAAGAYRHPWRSNGRGPQQMSSASAGRKMLWEGRSERKRTKMLRSNCQPQHRGADRVPPRTESRESVRGPRRKAGFARWYKTKKTDLGPVFLYVECDVTTRP